MPDLRPKRIDHLLLLGILLWVSLVTSGRFANGFVWDDVDWFERSHFLEDLGNAPQLFVHNVYFAGSFDVIEAPDNLDLYRPLPPVTYMLDLAGGSAVSGGRVPWRLHLTDLLFHLVAIVLVWRLAVRLLPSGRRRWALAPALVFGVHPLFAEAHVWISARFDTMAAVFTLAAFLLLLPAPRQPATRPSWPRTVAASVAALLALLSKEVALFAFPVIVAWCAGLFTARRSEWRLRDGLHAAAALGLPAALYLVLRVHALQGLDAAGGSAHLAAALLRVPYYLFDGAIHLLAPTATAVRFIREEYAALPDAVFLAAWLPFLATLVAALRWRRSFPVLSAGWLWFCAILAPATLISLLRWYGFGRYLYLPSVLLLIGLTDAVSRVARRRKFSRAVRRLAAVAFALYALGLSALLGLATHDWSSEETFYAAILRDYPDRSHGPGGLGRVLVERGDYSAAIPYLEEAVDRAPEDDRYLNNLAQALLRSGNPVGAAAVARVGRQRFPGEAKFAHVLAFALASEDPTGAIDQLLVALRLEPAYAPSLQLLDELLTRHPERERLAVYLTQQLGRPENAALRPRLRSLLDGR